jgi:catechol 2,3-dioxygenase-like lactoylglutathione lyase family enzyme
MECDDPRRLAEFYIAALGGQVVKTGEDFVSIEVGDGSLMAFHQEVGYRAPTWPSPEVGMQMHLELYADDPDAAVAHLCDVGATLLDYQPEAHTGLTVLLDPAGHPFCVFAPPASSSPDSVPS